MTEDTPQDNQPGTSMSFHDALGILGIEDYAERIWKSNSHGELFHLIDYVVLAEILKDGGAEWFRPWFEGVVSVAEENWERPESVFQHIYRIFHEHVRPDNG